MSQRQRHSLHIGCETIESGYPAETFPPIPGAKADAVAGCQIAEGHNFAKPLVWTTPADATSNAVLKWLNQWAGTSEPVDLFISFTGHGSHRVLIAEGKEPPGPCATIEDTGGEHEYWILNGGPICDRTLAQVWINLPAGSRVLVLADCCRGGGSIWVPPITASLSLRWFWSYCSYWSELIVRNPTSAWDCPDIGAADWNKIGASVVLLAAVNAKNDTTTGFVTAIQNAFESNPKSYDELLAATKELWPTVKPCHFGSGWEAMWNAPPLS